MTKTLVILSGKGGTGKTSVAAAFAHLSSESPVRALFADADVDASNLELLVDPEIKETNVFEGGKLAVIDPALCEGSGTCVETCRFDAIFEGHPPRIDPLACDGCAACATQCPHDAIRMEQETAGHWFRSDSRFGPLFHAALRPAQDNSGKLVTVLRREADALADGSNYDVIIVDGPPGIGCPVISATTGADLVLIVTEPTSAALHDLERALDTAEHFRVPAMVCINKYDLYPEGAVAIEEFLKRREIEMAGSIPFDGAFTEALVRGVPVTEFSDSPAAKAIQRLWKRVVERLIPFFR